MLLLVSTTQAAGQSGPSDGRDSVRVTTLQAALSMEDWDDNYEESDNYEGYDDKPCSICPVPGKRELQSAGVRDCWPHSSLVC